MKKANTVFLVIISICFLATPLIFVSLANSGATELAAGSDVAVSTSEYTVASSEYVSENAVSSETSSREESSAATISSQQTQVYTTINYTEYSEAAEPFEESLYSTTTSRVYGLDGFVNSDLEVLRQKIDMEDSYAVKYYDPDPEEFLPVYAPFLKMDIDTFFHIFKILKKYDWQPHSELINVFGEKGCTITIVSQDTVVTDLKFATDADGRHFAWSDYDLKIAYLSEKDNQEIRSLFEAAPEWIEKYYEVTGYWGWRTWRAKWDADGFEVQ